MWIVRIVYGARMRSGQIYTMLGQIHMAPGQIYSIMLSLCVDVPRQIYGDKYGYNNKYQSKHKYQSQ